MSQETRVTNYPEVLTNRPTFLIGSIGGAFFLDPIYNELPSIVSSIEKNMNREQIIALMEPKNFTGCAEEQTKRFLTDEVSPVL